MKKIKLPPLPQSKSGRIKLGAAVGAGVLILLLLCFSGGPPPAPVIAPQPAVPVEKPLPPAPPNASNSTVILELFSPSDQALTHQITETTLSEQIEQTLTMSFVLVQCQMVSQDDYRDIFRALILYAERVKLAADATSAEALVRQIAESSGASYSLIYSRTACSDPQLPPLAKQIVEWTNHMLTPE